MASCILNRSIFTLFLWTVLLAQVPLFAQTKAQIQCRVERQDLKPSELDLDQAPYFVQYRAYTTESTQDPTRLELMSIIHAFETQSANANFHRSNRSKLAQTREQYLNSYPNRVTDLSPKEMLRIVSALALEKEQKILNTYAKTLELLSFQKDQNRYYRFYLLCDDNSKVELSLEEQQALQSARGLIFVPSYFDERKHFEKLYNDHKDLIAYLLESTDSLKIKNHFTYFLNTL